MTAVTAPLHGTADNPRGFYDPEFTDGYQTGAAVAFGLMGMAEAIRERLDIDDWSIGYAQGYENS